MPWSQLAGQLFLDWLMPPAGLRWLDVGCGTGAFTKLLIQRNAPMKHNWLWHGWFDAAAMALVIYFVPDPAKGVAEMFAVELRPIEEPLPRAASHPREPFINTLEIAG